MTAEKIILKYQEKGVKLFLNEDKLQFSGPKVSLMMMREKNYRLTKMILLPI